MSVAGSGPDDSTMREDATMVFRLPTNKQAEPRAAEPVHFLLLLEGEPPFKRFPLEHPPLTVGRQETSQYRPGGWHGFAPPLPLPAGTANR